MKQQAQASLEKKFSDLKQAIADYYVSDPSNDDVAYSGPSYDYVDSNISWLQSQLSDLWQAFWKHTQDGHLPPIEGAGQMIKALKALGLDESYDVQKKVIYANDGTRKGFNLELRLLAQK